MKIMIVGGRKKADFLASSLLSKGHAVTIIQDDESYAKALAEKHDEALVICGDGSEPDVLEDANIEDTHLVISLTPQDADNLVICQLAKRIYGVRRVFTTVSNPKNVEVFRHLGINSVISATHIVSDMIEQMASVEEIENLISFEHGTVVAMEVRLNKDSPVCNTTVAEIDIPEQSLIGCIIRGVQSIIPRGNTELRSGDKLIILSPLRLQEKVIQRVVGRRSS
ncbi:TrkA family potassium uptake protein [Alicyclobacillus sp. SO9]|uniref:potassium channel family protein n=1 Tax=Alicyclobacillus sp. SO9 TaxID=2665646 RepID=UPI0018E86F41|nr:NAD-binding protein [Alicyclobacillus sp. SO9]QQE77094.1 NAD-binding protein [Alicyclobacillus sp. SO9]